MRPCRNCRAPIENNVAVCPQCQTAQDDAPKSSGPVPTPILRRRLFRRAPVAPCEPAPSTPHRRGFVASVIADVFELLLDPRGFLFLAGLLLLGAVVGGALAGVRGMIAGGAGAIIAILVCFAFLRFLSSSEG